MGDVVVIDGSRGEGGGQILRTALSLSAITGRPFRISAIRAGRPKPGLRPQHLAAAKAVGMICGAKAAGAAPGSTELYFQPDALRPGPIRLDIGTAGSVALVLQAVAVPLGLADGPSRITLAGGTHVPGSPTVDFLLSDWRPAMEEFGFTLRLRCGRPGFFPAGGGELLALVAGGARPRPLERRFRGNLRVVQGRAFVSLLPREIAERMAREARRNLRRTGVSVRVDVEEYDGAGPGAGIHLEAVLEDGRRIGFSALGDRGRQAEWVARDAVNAFFEWIDSGAAVNGHLADQILLPLALADGPSVFTACPLTRHLVTNAEVIHRFLPARIRVSGRIGEAGEIRIDPGPG